MEGLGRTSLSRLRSLIDAKLAAAPQGRPATNRIQREELAVGFSFIPQFQNPRGDTHKACKQNEYEGRVEMLS